jgi:hypothetical protein
MGISPSDAERLIEAFGPIMKLHPQEAYHMDDPDAFFNSGLTTMSRGLVNNEDDHDTFNISHGSQTNAVITSEAALTGVWEAAVNDPRKDNPAYRYWITVNDLQKPGNQSRAKALVKVNQTDQHVDLEFWFFYPFNGPGRFRVTVGKIFTDYVEMQTCGRHYSGWEHVTVRLTQAPGTPTGWLVQNVYLSQHDLTMGINDLTKIQFSGTHPIIYVARDSHAHYTGTDKHYYLRPWSLDLEVGTAAVDLYDITADGGITFDTSQVNNHRVILLTVNGTANPTVTTPVWYSYDGRWGQYERLIHPYQLPVVPGVADPVAYTHKEVGSGPKGPGQIALAPPPHYTNIVFVPYRNLEAIVTVNGIGLSHNWLSPTWNWSGWQRFSGAPATEFSFVAATPAEGNVELFVIGEGDGTLYHSWLGGDIWAPFEPDFNHAPKMQNIAVVGYQNQAEVLGIGTDGVMYHTWFAGTWAPWEPHFKGAPDSLKSVTLAEAAGNVEAWAIAKDGTVYHNYLLPSWSWQGWVVNFNSAPKASTVAVIGYQGQIEVLLIGTDGRLYHTYYGDGNWAPWTADFQGAPPKLKSVTMAVAFGNVEAWMIGQDGTVYHNYLVPSWNWSTWEANPFGAPKMKTIAVAGWQGQIEAMGIGLDGNPVHNWFDGSWHHWQTPFLS